jgi:hypothetical protein
MHESDFCSVLPEGINTAETLISELPPPELQENKCIVLTYLVFSTL